VPSAPLRFCATPNCPEKVPHGHCAAHHREKRFVARRHYTGIPGVNYGRRWQRARQKFLTEHPYCRECPADSYTFATEVDHIVPHEGDYERFWDQLNWQGLCGTCHRKKTATESGLGRRQ
jgi:5-methylcytosine-specific restriction protein A